MHVGGATHGGRMFGENVRGHLRFFAKHRGPREAARARRLLLAALAAARRSSSAASAGGCTATPPARCDPRASRGSSLALPALGLARLLPETGLGLWVRLVAATACLLLPGALVARALRVAGLLGRPRLEPRRALRRDGGRVRSSTRRSALALVLLGGRRGRCARASPSVTRVQTPKGSDPQNGSRRPSVAAAGLGFGVALWSLTGHLTGGDDLFHLARVRKLDDFGGLSLRTVDEFRDGGLHPGYAFPLWHAFLALVARLGGVDPTRVVLHEASVLVPAAFLVAWESGKAVFRSAWGGLAVLARAGRDVRARRRGRRLVHRARPAGDLEPAAARPGRDRALLRLRREAVARRARHARGRDARRSRSSTRPTRSSCSIPLAGYVVARALLARTRGARGRRRACRGRRARRRRSRSGSGRSRARPPRSTPSADELQRALVHYKGQLDVFSDGSYRLAPEVFGRSGAIAVAGALRRPARRASAPAAAGRRSCSAASSPCSLLTLVPDALHALRRRRLDLAGPARAGFVPFAFAIAGGGRRARAAALARRALRRARGRHRLPARLSRATSATRSTRAAPPLATWVALFGGGAALVVGIFLPRRLGELDRMGWIAAATAALASCPSRCTASRTGTRGRCAATELTPGSCARSAPRCRRRRSSSRTTPRATRSPPSPRSTSRTRCRVTSPTRRRTGPTSAATDAERVLPHRRPGDPAPLRRDLARRRPAALEAEARPPAGVRGRARTSSTVYRS